MPKIERIELHHIDLPLVHPFETSFGREVTRPCILVSVHAAGLTGWGECVAGDGPWYASETIGTAWHVLADYLIPALLGQEIDEPADVVARFARVRGHAMARAALENAVWDLLAQARRVPLADMIGGRQERVPVGVSVGIEPRLEILLDRVAQYVDEGYGRVKLKIKPGWDVDVVRAVREQWPDLPLQVDANSAYSLADTPLLQALDPFNLLLIEQPLHHDDIVDHARLQAQLRTPLCLDESIHSPEHARWALDIAACRVINVKVGRVGGLTAALRIHDLCAERGVPVWCGGMLETNVGRAANVALAALPNFTLPGDISASARYYHRDIAEPDFVLNDGSTLTVPTGVGLGVQVIAERLAAVRLRRSVRACS
ncbi:MAG: o-succinylbenzoate synthase [Anaerolineae bacterium]|nr:o-succinylbenzoate synthase [Anaerolineae bacterium]